MTSLSAEYAYYYLAYPNHCISVTNICTKNYSRALLLLLVLILIQSMLKPWVSGLYAAVESLYKATLSHKRWIFISRSSLPFLHTSALYVQWSTLQPPYSPCIFPLHKLELALAAESLELTSIPSLCGSQPCPAEQLFGCDTELQSTIYLAPQLAGSHGLRWLALLFIPQQSYPLKLSASSAALLKDVTGHTCCTANLLNTLVLDRFVWESVCVAVTSTLASD